LHSVFRREILGFACRLNTGGPARVLAARDRVVHSSLASRFTARAFGFSTLAGSVIEDCRARALECRMAERRKTRRQKKPSIARDWWTAYRVRRGLASSIPSGMLTYRVACVCRLLARSTLWRIRHTTCS
jgi:hypothetical protein